MGADARDRHDETEAERLDRNLIELLNELRVIGTGIQVMLAFLLVVPFNSGYKRLSEFDRIVYFVALLCIAASAAMLIAPSVHHRLLFRQGQRRTIVSVGNTLALAGMSLLSVGLVAILVLLSNVVFGTVAAVAVGVAAAALLTGVWWVLPLVVRGRPVPHDHTQR